MSSSPGNLANDGDAVAAIVWRDGELTLLDQRRLPHEAGYLPIPTIGDAAAAITDMIVRGAPAIGVTAAYGAVLGAQAALCHGDGWRVWLEGQLSTLREARPTAVNLLWAVDAVRAIVRADDTDASNVVSRVTAFAQGVHARDLRDNRRMGEIGAAIIEPAAGILTHCNTGSLATGGYGTALGVIRSAWRQQKFACVFAGETRPWLQGARLTAWELVQDNIPVQLVADGAMAYLMQQGEARWVVVGADRVAANGDVANKIGTYSLAVNARQHGLGFMVAAPTSTIDRDTANGRRIPIERRDGAEVLQLGGQRIAAAGADAWNPVFDVTPAALVDVLVTERGAVFAPNSEKIARLFK